LSQVSLAVLVDNTNLTIQLFAMSDVSLDSQIKQNRKNIFTND